MASETQTLGFDGMSDIISAGPRMELVKES